jgi:hypothetical protein
VGLAGEGSMKKKFAVPLIAVFVISFAVTAIVLLSRIENNKYDVQYIRTNGGSEEVDFPVITVISSKAELERYYGDNKDDYNMSADTTCTISFANATKEYTDDFFTDKYLVLVLLQEGSGSNRHKLKSIDEDGNVVINRIVPKPPRVSTSDMAQWHLIIELDTDFRPLPFYVTITE